MGSGFLVCAPLLYAHVGNNAVFAMAGLLLLAYGIGSVIRFNIRHAEPFFDAHTSPKHVPKQEHKLHKSHRETAHKASHLKALNTFEKISHLILTCAYCISVSYYLQLLSHFSLQSFAWSTPAFENGIVTVILLGIGAIGLFRGLNGIERVERIVVSLNLALILSLIVGLIYFNASAYLTGDWHLIPLPIDSNRSHLIGILMGLLIVVQGFETSRFLGSEHPAEERIRTMRQAQIISSLIYIVFLALMALVMSRADFSASSSGVTAIIHLSGLVATVLPVMITLTAIGSQFSAATADDAGCAGLLQTFLKHWRGLRLEYAIVSIIAITLTWVTNIYEIISIASRAFALYYLLQCIVALIVVQQSKDIKHRHAYFIGFAALALCCAAVTIFGVSAE